jgi:hypothetical protein
MYSTCLFCHADLGSNEVLETFPIGRQLAFDADKGRLWAVCPKCGRWNLTPLEERWEAVETCERRFRGMVLRASTDNIGLTRLREGLELVRIGKPLRPELAFWRYSTTLRWRRNQYALMMAGATGAVLLSYAGVAALGVGTAVAAGAWQVFDVIQSSRANRRVAANVVDAAGASHPMTPPQVRAASIMPGDGQPWTLRIWDVAGAESFLSGEHALRALGLLLPRINVTGAGSRDVNRAVERIEAAGSATVLLTEVAALKPPRTGLAKAPVGSIANLSRTDRLALEIVAHEDTERRAMDGELAELERAWREAEEIASIADNLLLPPSVTEFFRRRS